MKRRLPLILILAILAALVVALFLPRPLLKPNSDYEVLIVRYNPTYDAQPTDIPTFDSDAIVACLRNYKAENAFTTTPPSSSYTDILLEITVRQKVDQGDDWKTFWLGKTNYVYFGKFMYRIPDGNALQNELLQALSKPDELTDFLEEVRLRCQFQYHFFGHYHGDLVIRQKYVLLYEQILRLK